MAGQFFPPPPQFVGGSQPYAAHTPDPFGVILTSNPPPVHPPVWPETQSRIVLTWFFPPPSPPPQQLQGSITTLLPRDPPPFGLAGIQQIQNMAVAAWQPPPPAPFQKPPTAIFYPIPKPVVVTPPPPQPIPAPIFPHDDEDDGWKFWSNTRRSEADRLKKMRQEIGLLPPDPPSEAEHVQELLDDPTLSTDFIVQQLSAHYFAKYQTALRQAQARADLARETRRKRQDFYLSSAERATRTEQGKRLVLKRMIEEDDAQAMALIEKLLN